MTARSSSVSRSARRAPQRKGRDAPRPGFAAAPDRLRTAIGLSALVTVLAAAAPLLGVVTPSAGPGFASWPLLALLAALPPGLAALLASRGRYSAAAAVLVPPAVLVPARLLADLQIAMDSVLAARPELVIPTQLAPAAPSLGFAALMLGQLATVVAGVLAFGQLRDGMAPAGSRETAETSAEQARASAKQGRLALALCAGLVAATGLASLPFRSDDAFVSPRALLDVPPPLVLVGGVLACVLVPLLAAICAGTADPDVATGGLLGTAAAVLGLAAPALAAALLQPDLHLTWGPLAAVLSALGLFGLAKSPTTADEVELPGQRRLQLVAAVAALVAGVAALIGGTAPLLVLPSDVPPAILAGLTGTKVLIPAGAVLLVLGAVMAVPRWSATVRPVLAAAWPVVPFAAAAPLGTVFMTGDLGRVDVGGGVWAVGIAVLAALVAGCCAGLAGGVERDDVDLSETSVRRDLVVPAALAIALAVGAYVAPLASVPGKATDTPAVSGLLAPFSTASWGLLCALVAVAAAAGLAPRCRPARAAALFLGAALVVGVRVLQLPLTSGQVEGAAAGPGEWLAVGCLAVLLIGAGIAAYRTPSGQTQPS